MSACRLSVTVEQTEHRGLYLDKFLPVKPEVRAKGEKQDDPQTDDRFGFARFDTARAKGEKQDDPQTLALKALGRARCDTPVYKLAYKRWQSYWSGQSETVVCREGAVRDRLAVGLGMESVLENGVRLQHTYGTPLIPGSSLKGVLRRGLPVEHRDRPGEKERSFEWYLFGDTHREGAARFHHAWWVPDAAPPLALDVLTPHHQEYMQRKDAPTDFDNPVPVHFLTVRGRFLFVIEAPNPSWKTYLEALLQDVIGREGIGAKRSAGYGVIDLR
jgi:CRISPR-associated protein Cmr6